MVGGYGTRPSQSLCLVRLQRALRSDVARPWWLTCRCRIVEGNDLKVILLDPRYIKKETVVRNEDVSTSCWIYSEQAAEVAVLFFSLIS